MLDMRDSAYAASQQAAARPPAASPPAVRLMAIASCKLPRRQAGAARAQAPQQR
jgi:hypothetical protein